MRQIFTVNRQSIFRTLDTSLRVVVEPGARVRHQQVGARHAGFEDAMARARAPLYSCGLHSANPDQAPIASHRQGINMLKHTLMAAFALTGALLCSSSWAQSLGQVPETSLEAAIRQALTYYPSISQAERQYMAQNEEVLGAKAQHWPTAGLEGSTSWHSDARYNVDDSTGVLVRIPVYSGGRIESNVKVQEALYDKAGQQVTLARDDVVLRASSGYLGWYHAVRAVDFAQANLAMIDSIVKDVKDVAQFDPGRRADVDQAIVRQAKAQQELARRQSALVQAQANYQRYIGELPSGEGDLTDSKILPALPESLSSGLTHADFDHPKILAAQADARAAQANIDVAKARTRPDLSVDVRSSHGGSAMLNMTWTGFDLVSGHAVSSATSSSFAAQNALEEVRLQVFESLRQSWAAMEGAQSRQVAAQVQVDVGEQVLYAYKDQFQIGRRSLLDLLNASDEVYSNRLSALTTESDLYYARYQVAAALGRLAEHY